MEFEELYKTYWQKIFRLCMGYVMIMTLRRTLLRKHLCLAKQETFRNESSIGTWIRIASNNCLRQIEKKIGFQSRTSCKHYRRKHKSLEPQIQFLQMHCRTSGNRPYYYLTNEEVKQAEIAKIVGLSEANIRVKFIELKKN
jgi:RNA polymerase sigma-70 factor (ECF subfamily)